MKQNNTFYILKNSRVGFIINYGYNLETGELEQQNSTSCFEKHFGGNRIILSYIVHHTGIKILKWNKHNAYLGYEVISTSAAEAFKIDYRLKNDEYYVAVVLNGTVLSGIPRILDEQIGYSINPHYKQIKRQYKKESGQAFFRESLNGKISLFGTDYELIKANSINENLQLNVYTNDSLIATAYFNKIDCTFDDYKKSVELKLTYNDKYTKILDALENTYDLIKLAPAITPIALTKRCVMQIYIQGERVISSYAGGTYWETEVDNSVDDADELERHFHFSQGPKFVEVNLTGFNYKINATFSAIENESVWNAICKEVIAGQIYKRPCSLKFTKIYDAYENYSEQKEVHLLSTGQGNGIEATYGRQYCLYDTYQIEIYTDYDGTGNCIYKSTNYYGKDTDKFILSPGYGLYPMEATEQVIQPEPSLFNLGEYTVEYQIWARLLCDSESGTYDLPYDDFAASRDNYKKCIGLSGFNTDNSTVKIIQSSLTIDKPTQFGMNDYGEYFVDPGSETFPFYFYPLARSSWANTSLWIRFNTPQSFEEQCSNFYKEYQVKDCYHISDVIKSLLKAIGSTVTHEKTAEYSQFLYSHSGASASVLGNCDLYISQKTNILKGEYDQAAQKAEIKLKQVTDMLRDCFRCYWFIDEQNRFRIEHIFYFINGMSYDAPLVQLDLTTKFDKFNKKCVIYDQENIEYDKSELISRYEFAYMDDVTKAMGGDLFVNVNDTFIPKDKTEEINIDGFTADVDYMLFMPDNFSQDGFALLLANSNKKVPIVHQRIKDETRTINEYFDVWVQNWYASFNQLINHYMYDISGDNLQYNNISSLNAVYIKKCMKQNIRLQPDFDIDLNKIILTNLQSSGYIEEKSVDIDTNVTEIELRYTPS